MFGCKCNHSGSCILIMLKLLDSLFCQSIQKWITEVPKKWKCAQVFLLYGNWYISLYGWYFEGGRSLPHTAVTWCSIDMTVPYRTPIFLAVNVLLINSSQTEIDVRGGGGQWLAFYMFINFYLYGVIQNQFKKMIPLFSVSWGLSAFERIKT